MDIIINYYKYDVSNNIICTYVILLSKMTTQHFTSTHP